MSTASLPLPAPPRTLWDGAISLFLDFDGTLVDLADRHDGVTVGSHVPALLAGLSRRLDGRLAIVSGRPAREILAYLGGSADTSRFAVAGSHGLEMIHADGALCAPEPPATIAAVMETLGEFAHLWPGVVIEEKPFGAAIHYRLAPDAAGAAEAVAADVANRYGLTLQRGKMVYELRAAGADKGDAVRRFLDQAPMTGTRPIFIGDDLTDEAGFAAADALGGAGILVGDRDGGTLARYGLPDVAAVHAWLGAYAGVPA